MDTRQIANDVARATDEFPLALTHLNITEDIIPPHSRRLLTEGHRIPAIN